MTAGVPHINLSMLRNFQVIWPSFDLQYSFGSSMELLGNQVECLGRAIENARATRDILLPRLMSGEIDVTDLDIVVPEMGT
jgi:type I restriction enzyme S subunit